MSDQVKMAALWPQLITHVFYEYIVKIAHQAYEMPNEKILRLGQEALGEFNQLLLDFLQHGVIVDRLVFRDLGVVVAIHPLTHRKGLRLDFKTSFSLRFYELLQHHVHPDPDYKKIHDLDELVLENYCLLLRSSEIKHYPEHEHLTLDIPDFSELERIHDLQAN